MKKAAPREADQAQAERLCATHRQRRRRAARDDNADADGGRLLHHLEAGATGQQHRALPSVDARTGERADQLVERVVAAHVLAQQGRRLAGGQPGGRVGGAGQQTQVLALIEVVHGAFGA